MDLIIILILIIVTVSLGFQFLNRDATNRAIRAVEQRVSLLEAIAKLEASAPKLSARQLNEKLAAKGAE